MAAIDPADIDEPTASALLHVNRLKDKLTKKDNGMTHPTEPLDLHRIDYGTLNSRQKETYNFQRVAGRLAEYGYNCILLSDDWLGADFIAYHNDGVRFYRVQLKGRMTIDDRYIGKDLYIAFMDDDQVYVYPHDEMANRIEATGKVNSSESWSKYRSYSWPSVSKWMRELLKEFEVA